jgi:hypothetical protein
MKLKDCNTLDLLTHQHAEQKVKEKDVLLELKKKMMITLTL